MKHSSITSLLLLFVLCPATLAAAPTYTLPWEQMFSREYNLDSRAAMAAVDISGLDLNFNNGLRAGLWGLTPYAARRYGLTINHWQDDRFDLGKASRAAARYIKDLINIYHGDTLTALDAFVNTPLVMPTDTLYICPSFRAPALKQHMRAGLDSAFAVTDEQRAAETQRIALLRAEYAARQAQEDSIREAARLKAIAEANATKVHTVRQGETLGHIAIKYHCTVGQLKQWNGLRSDMIRIGQKLKIKRG